MRKIGAYLIGTALLFSMTFAKELTLDEAINVAKENSATIAMAKAEERQQEKDYKKAQNDTRKWQNKQSYAFETPTDYLLYYGYYLEQAELKYNLYLASIKNAEDGTAYNLTNTVYNLELLDNQIELLEKNVKLMEKQKLVHELKYKLNRITKLELDNFNLKLETTKNSLQNVKDQRELAYENLQIMLGTKEDVTVKLPELNVEELSIEDLDKYIEENINNNKMVIELDYNYKVVENNYLAIKNGPWDDAYMATTNSPSLQRKIMKDNYDAMGVQVESSKNNLEMLYKSQYNKIKSSELEIAQAKQNLEIAKINMETVQKRYDAGYVAQLDYEAAKLNLENEEITYKTKLINNILLNAQFEAFVNSGAGITINN